MSFDALKHYMAIVFGDLMHRYEFFESERYLAFASESCQAFIRFEIHNSSVDICIAKTFPDVTADYSIATCCLQMPATKIMSGVQCSADTLIELRAILEKDWRDVLYGISLKNRMIEAGFAEDSIYCWPLKSLWMATVVIDFGGVAIEISRDFFEGFLGAAYGEITNSFYRHIKRNDFLPILREIFIDFDSDCCQKPDQASFDYFMHYIAEMRCEYSDQEIRTLLLREQGSREPSSHKPTHP